MSLFSKLNLKVAIVEDVQNHPCADKLYVLKINIGEPRQLVAGIKQYYTSEQLHGKHLVVISNLKPALLRDVESQGMLLAAQAGDTVRILEAPQSPAGEPVFVPGETPSTEQITIDDFKRITLTTKNKKAVFEGQPLRTKKEEIQVDIEDHAIIR